MNVKPRSKKHARRAVDAPLTKSEQMARVRSKNTEAEMILRSALWRAGLRFRVTCRYLPGSPDIAFTRWRLAVFVDGCFWHGCPIHYTPPKANSDFWQQKLARNCARDALVNSELEALGWAVLRVWEHEVSNADTIPTVVKRIRNALAVASRSTPFRLQIQR
jgi:DNA mismatch endonuclease (patch repair protein)